MKKWDLLNSSAAREKTWWGISSADEGKRTQLWRDSFDHRPWEWRRLQKRSRNWREIGKGTHDLLWWSFFQHISRSSCPTIQSARYWNFRCSVLKKDLIGVSKLDFVRTLSKTLSIESDKKRKNKNIMVSDNTKIGTGLLFLVCCRGTCRGF